jgi:hypothetical protein
VSRQRRGVGHDKEFPVLGCCDAYVVACRDNPGRRTLQRAIYISSRKASPGGVFPESDTRIEMNLHEGPVPKAWSTVGV